MKNITIMGLVCELERKGYKCEITKTIKNGNPMIGIMFDLSRNAKPVIYPDLLEFSCVEDAVSVIEHIISETGTEIEQSQKTAELLSDYENIKDKLILCVCPRCENANYIRFPLFDFDLIIRVVIKAENGKQMSVIVDDDILKKWKMDIDDVFSQAINNADFCVYDLYMFPFAGKIELEKDEYDTTVQFIVSNKNGEYGANVFYFDSFFDLFAMKLKEGFYILPSSIHEVICVRESYIREFDNTMEAEQYLKDMVKTINEESVSPMEILTNSVYKYNYDTKEIVIIP